MRTQEETIRAFMCEKINARAAGRDELSRDFGDVWDTSELQDKFEVLGFLAPFCVVRRKADGVKGSLLFQHEPRFYFNFDPVSE